MNPCYTDIDGTPLLIPDWNNAPDWANWLHSCPDGSWWWTENKPKGDRDPPTQDIATLAWWENPNLGKCAQAALPQPQKPIPRLT